MSIDITKEREEEFWEQVQRGEDCWAWKGYLDHGGYGIMVIDGVRRRTHRIAWCLAHAHQYLPSHHQVKHTCRNNACVRESHLKLKRTKPRKSLAPAMKRTANSMRYTGAHDTRRQNGKPKWRDFTSYVRSLKGVDDRLSVIQTVVTDIEQKFDLRSQKPDKKRETERDISGSPLGLLLSSIVTRLDQLEQQSAATQKAALEAFETIKEQSLAIATGPEPEPKAESKPEPEPEPAIPARDDHVELREVLMKAFQAELGFPENPDMPDYEALLVVFDVASAQSGGAEEAVRRFGIWLSEFKRTTGANASADRSPWAFAKMMANQPVAVSSTDS